METTVRQRGRRGVQRRCGRRWRQDERVEVSERTAAETEEMGQMGSESEASSGAYAQRAGKSAHISAGCTRGVAARLAEGALRACSDVEAVARGGQWSSESVWKSVGVSHLAGLARDQVVRAAGLVYGNFLGDGQR